MKKGFLLAVVMVFLLSAAGVVAEDNGQLMTVEELFLSDDITVQILREQVTSPRRDMKADALETIREMVEAGEIDENDEAMITMLQILALDGSRWRITDGGGVFVRRNPDIRRDAAELLGRIGGRRAEIVLRQVLRRDEEPMVLAEAMYALGRTGVDDAGRSATQMAQVLVREHAREHPDNNLMYSTLLALERLAENGYRGIAESTLISSLVDITHGPYTRLVRDQARSVLDSMRNM